VSAADMRGILRWARGQTTAVMSRQRGRHEQPPARPNDRRLDPTATPV